MMHSEGVVVIKKTVFEHHMFEILQQLRRRKEIENTKVKIQFCESRHKEEQYFIVYIYHIFNIFGFV